ncbi:MAG: ATP-binding protein [Saprospiraceae bacterium]|nr:ATP-binding protein [Saprospiraceae bacterium]
MYFYEYLEVPYIIKCKLKFIINVKLTLFYLVETGKIYKDRITDIELVRKLNASGAVLIRGPKACGKTESAKQIANSILHVDRDEQVQALIDIEPRRLLLGETPRLIDDWQAQPKLWDYIRHEIDDRQKSAQFILTGSANPEESVKMHSGAGRFTIVDMRSMCWQELGHSTGKVSLSRLFNGGKIDIHDQPCELEFIIEKIIIGGFPTLLNREIDEAIELNRAYVELLAEVDMSRVSDVKRDPEKVRCLLRSLARNTATLVEITSLQKDLGLQDSAVSRPTIYNYLDALHRLMILEDQAAWNTHIRSSSALRKSPKRHFTDVSLAVAALGADKNLLLNDLNFTGYLFESMVTHDLRVYAQANDAKVYHYRDSSGLEVDCIVQKYNGDWCAFEIKLGTGKLDEAAASLIKFKSILDEKKVKPPCSLNIITGTGISYTRKDGINVITLASLGV